jgi:hypothetical protein
MTEPEFHGFRYKLSNMPSRATLIAGLTTLVFAKFDQHLHDGDY